MLGPSEARTQLGLLGYELGTYHGVSPKLLIVQYDRDGIVVDCRILIT